MLHREKLRRFLSEIISIATEARKKRSDSVPLVMYERTSPSVQFSNELCEFDDFIFTFI